MNKEFVSYDIALTLKELGFDEPCLGNYRLPSNRLITEWEIKNKQHHYTNKHLDGLERNMV